MNRRSPLRYVRCTVHLELRSRPCVPERWALTAWSGGVRR
jgi:hypothetical protein